MLSNRSTKSIAALSLALAACPMSHRASQGGVSDAGSNGILTPPAGNNGRDDAFSRDAAVAEEDATSDGDPKVPRVPPGGIEHLPILTAGIFDPAEVHMLGQTHETFGQYDAFGPVLAPDQGLVGFPRQTSGWGLVIRPTDGRLLYMVNAGVVPALFAFHVDPPSPVRGSLGSNRYNSKYPEDPTSNDERIPTPACLGDRILLFLVSPDGEIVYHCKDGWYQGDELVLPYNNYRSFGPKRTLWGDSKIVSLETKATVPIVGLPSGEPFAIRARPDGYWLLFSAARSPESPYLRLELWHTTLDGLATREGTYPLPLDQIPSGRGILDGQGRAVQNASSNRPPFLSTIIRRSLDGDTEVLYDQLNDPFLKIGVNNLVTGP